MQRLTTVCPHCGETHTGVSCFAHPHALPVDGDCHICIKCGGWGIMEKGKLRLPTLVELLRMSVDNEVMRTQRAWRAMDKRRKENEGC